MLAVINEKQLTEEQREMLELEKLVPGKFDHEIEFKLNKEHSDKKPKYGYATYTREQVALLLKAGNESVKQVPKEKVIYDTPPRHLIEQMVREHNEYNIMEAERKKLWDSTKTIE